VLVLTPFVPLTVEPSPALAQADPAVIGAGVSGFGAAWDTYGTSALLLLLLFAAFFALFGNGSVLWRVGRGNLKMVGGSVAHVGMALMLLGIVATSVFNRPLTDGRGASLRGDRDNFIIQQGETKPVQGYRFTYAGQRLNERGRPVYDIDVVDRRGRAFRASAEVYESKTGQWIQHPHVQPSFLEDLYMAVYPAAMMQPAGGADAQAGELILRRGELAPLDDGSYSLRFTAYDLNPDRSLLDVPVEQVEIAVGAHLEVIHRASGETRRLAPVYAVTSDGSQHYVQNRIPEWDLAFTFAGMQVDDDAVRILVEGARTTPEDWLVVQAIRKPFINLLWLGTIVLAFGFGIAAFRRGTERRR
jgi:cytochrome c-type biogenesis protein CcmF